jgi:hypothetical protein
MAEPTDTEPIEATTDQPQTYIDWESPSKNVTMKFSNFAGVQIWEDNIILHLFHTYPVIILGTEEERELQRKARAGLPFTPDCVGRFTIQMNFAKSLIKVMQEKVDEYDASKRQE